MHPRLAVLLLGAGAILAACSTERDPQDQASAVAGDTIECALRGASAFTRDCMVERAPQGGVLYLVVRHPDGAFRRFQVLKDGRGVAVADGAETAETRIADGLLEVTVGKDRYRFPATRKSHAPTS
jgi:hypothetical protein